MSTNQNSDNERDNENEHPQNQASGQDSSAAENNAEEKDEEQEGMSQRKKYILYGVGGVILIAALIYGWNWWQFAQNHVSTRNANIEGHISPVIPRIKGYIKHIYVDDNEQVSKGQLLATIDKSDYKVAVQKAKSQLASARASYEDARARLATMESMKEQAAVKLNQSRTEKNRQKRLYHDQSTTERKFTNAKYAFQSAQASYKVAKRKVNSARSNVQKAKSQIKSAQSSLDKTKLQLSYTNLTAPIGGQVSKKSIEPGQFVSPGNAVMAIAKDDSVWVVANFKESDVAPIRVGQPVDITVDAYSGTTFKGTVQSIAGATGSKFALLPPDNASGNFVKVAQRIPVKIVFNKSNPHGQNNHKVLKPGMFVEPTVDISNTNN